MKYKQLYELSLQIGELIERGLYNEISLLVSRKDKILSEISNLSAKISKNGEDSSYLRSLCQKIAAQEKANLGAMDKICEKIKSELHMNNKVKKVASAYSSAIPEAGNILDWKE